MGKFWWSSGTGCTACVVLITPDKIICANIGDSRAILKTGDQVVALSEDHKPNDPKEKERIKNYGMVVSADGRVDGILAVARAFGDFYFKSKMEAMGPAAQAVTADPDFKVVTRSSADKFIVIACDGIWDVKGNQECADFIEGKIDERGLEEWHDLTDPIEIMLDDICAS